jgi:hypothetical protein
MPETINGYDIDLLARTLYDVRSMSPTECTDEQWSRHAEQFSGTHRMLLAEARRIAEEDD